MIEQDSVTVDFIEYDFDKVVLHVSGQFEQGGKFYGKVPFSPLLAMPKEHDYKAIADWLADYVATDAPTPPDYVRNYLLGEEAAPVGLRDSFAQMLADSVDSEPTTDTGTYGKWHTQPEGSPWRKRDHLAHFVGYHCWDCWWKA